MYRLYDVTVTPVNPSYYDRPGVVTVEAKTAADAIKDVRRQMDRSRYDSPVRYSARLAR